MLLVRALHVLARRGVSEMRLITDAGNRQSARSLYESVGFRMVKEQRRYRKPLSR